MDYRGFYEKFRKLLSSKNWAPRSVNHLSLLDNTFSCSFSKVYFTEMKNQVPVEYTKNRTGYLYWLFIYERSMRKFPVFNDKFQNLTEKNMSFEDVFQHIIRFMQSDPTGNYRLMFGTDSQVHKDDTRFITGIVIQRERKGVWACIRKVIVPRKMTNLHERISFETTLTEEVVSLFTEEKKNRLIDIILPNIYRGASLIIEGHIDIGAGRKNKTRKFVKEMVSRMESIGVEPKIKPESFVASCYANRYTK